MKKRSYIEIIGKYYSTYQVSAPGLGSIYEEIDWVEETPIPESALNSGILEDYKKQKKAEMSAEVRDEIIVSFTSSALGSVHSYSSDVEDQINIIGAYSQVEVSGTMYYPCYEGITKVGTTKQYKVHTKEQLHEVLQDGANFKLGKLQNFTTKCACVDVITLSGTLDDTITVVDNITLNG